MEIDKSSPLFFTLSTPKGAVSLLWYSINYHAISFSRITLYFFLSLSVWYVFCGLQIHFGRAGLDTAALGFDRTVILTVGMRYY